MIGLASVASVCLSDVPRQQEPFCCHAVFYRSLSQMHPIVGCLFISSVPASRACAHPSQEKRKKWVKLSSLKFVLKRGAPWIPVACWDPRAAPHLLPLSLIFLLNFGSSHVPTVSYETRGYVECVDHPSRFLEQRSIIPLLLF